MSTATPLSYDQPIEAHYGTIFTRYLRRTNEPPPTGWQRGVIDLPQNAPRVDPSEENRFMENLLRLIREQCSKTDVKDVSRQGLWITNFEDYEVVNKYLQGSTLKLYVGKPMPDQVWLDIAAIGKPWSGKGPMN
ncbi:MAG: hypothetical protein ABSG23_09200 [Terriglobales bacterium]|jgi:hypothetical protein